MEKNNKNNIEGFLPKSYEILSEIYHYSGDLYPGDLMEFYLTDVQNKNEVAEYISFTLNKILILSPKDYGLYLQRAIMYFHLGKIDQALQDIRSAQKLSNNNTLLMDLDSLLIVATSNDKNRGVEKEIYVETNNYTKKEIIDNRVVINAQPIIGQLSKPIQIGFAPDTFKFISVDFSLEWHLRILKSLNMPNVFEQLELFEIILKL